MAGKIEFVVPLLAKARDRDGFRGRAAILPNPAEACLVSCKDALHRRDVRHFVISRDHVAAQVHLGALLSRGAAISAGESRAWPRRQRAGLTKHEVACPGLRALVPSANGWHCLQPPTLGHALEQTAKTKRFKWMGARRPVAEVSRKRRALNGTFATSALHVERSELTFVKFANSCRMCVAMDLHPTATPTRFAIGEIRFHVRSSHTIRSYMVHA
jgi:hypothetical protein